MNEGEGLEQLSLDFNEATEVLTKELNIWLKEAIAALPNLAIAVLVAVVFVFLAGFVSKFSKKLLSRVSQNHAVNGLVTRILSIAVAATGLFIALGVLNLDKTVTSLLAGAGVIGLALGFAFQEIASNFIAGIFIAFNKPYQIGDIIETGDYTGTVDQIKLRTTNLVSFQGLEVIIPNKQLFTDAFTNFTSTPYRRVDLTVGVSYGDDLHKVEELTLKAIKEIDVVMQNKPIEFFFEEFDSSSINFQLRFWVKYKKHTDFLKARHLAVHKVKDTFDENGITIPFPIRTLDFGILGGEKLKTQLKVFEKPSGGQ